MGDVTTLFGHCEEDVFTVIFQNLDASSVIRCAKVCKLWQRVVYAQFDRRGCLFSMVGFQVALSPFVTWGVCKMMFGDFDLKFVRFKKGFEYLLSLKLRKY